MRKLVYRALTESTSLMALIPRERWLSGGSVDVAPARPFAVWRFAGDTRSPSRHAIPRLEVWIHDDKGSYTRIDDILAAVKIRLDGASFSWVDLPGQCIAQIDWQSNSPDLIDDGYNTNTRMASYQLVGRSST